jgi:hypothetical protein
LAEVTKVAIGRFLGLTQQETPNDRNHPPIRPAALAPDWTWLPGSRRKKSITADMALFRGSPIPDRQRSTLHPTGLEKEPIAPPIRPHLIGANQNE